MGYRLAALRFKSIGERSARFTDLTLDLTAPTGDTAEPQDTVIWLRNGGGKSSILSLLYAQLLPRAHDFMGRAVKRSLTDYVDSGDTAHVIAVWESVTAARPLLGAAEGTLLTGTVHEWDDLRRPAQPETSRDRLSSWFYVFHVVPGVADLAALPLTDNAGRPRRLAAYLEALKEQTSPYGQRTSFISTPRQGTWAEELMKRDMDPEAFRPQKQMNHVEGGVEDLFRFPAAKDFIDFLLDLTTAPDAVASIATRLGKVAERIRAKPAKAAEQGFCGAAAAGLDEVAARHTDVRTADERRAQAEEAAARLAAAFRATVAAADVGQRELDVQEEAVNQERTRLNNERSQANDLNYLYRRVGARLRVAEAASDEAAAADEAATASALARAWEAVGPLARLAELTAALDQARLAAEAEEREIVPLRDEHDRHAARLRLRLNELAAAANDAAAQADGQKASAQADADHAHGLAEQARTERLEADREATEARTRLETLDARLRDGVARGHLPSVTASPGEQQAAASAARDRLQHDLDDLAGQTAVRRIRREQIRQREAELTEQRTEADRERRAVVELNRSLSERLAQLTEDTRIRELAEASPGEPVSLWAEAPVILRRLSDAMLAADEERVMHRAEQHAGQRTIEDQERNGYLPSSLDADQVRRELGGGATAQTGWEYLRENLPTAELATATDNPLLARLGCGVVVPTAAVRAAADLLDASGIRTISLVGVYSAADADALIAAARRGAGDSPVPAWAGLQHGLVDQDAARAAVRLLKERAASLLRRDQELVSRREADQQLRSEVTAFLADCPAGHLAFLDEETGRLDARLESIRGEQESLRKERRGLDDADDQGEASRTAINGQLRAAAVAIAWLDDLIPMAQAAAGWRTAMTDAEGRAADAGYRADHHAANEVAASTAAMGFEQIARERRRQAGDFAAEAAELSPMGQAEPQVDAADPAVPLEALRRNRQTALDALNARAAQSVLTDRVRRLTDEVSAANRQVESVPPHDRDAARQLIATPAGQAPGLRAAAVDTARAADRQAAERLALARAGTQQRKSELDAIDKARTAPPRRTLPVNPSSADEADALAGEQEAASQGLLDRIAHAGEVIDGIGRQRDQLVARVRLLNTLLDSLPADTPAGPTAPFTGSEDDARTQAQAARGLTSVAQHDCTQAETALNTAIDQLRRASAKYSEVPGPVKDRVMHDPARALAPQAAELARKLRLRARTLAEDLESIGADQRILSEALAHLVRESLDMLGKAERGSQLATASGSWAGKRVLRISYDHPDDANLAVYAERVIDRAVQAKLSPEGMPLLKAAVHEAAGPRGFTVKVLKPTDDATVVTEDISRLSKWSGGEKLTVCVALYCTLAALRAARTGRGAHPGGVLLLDNPIGRASTPQLVRLQRDVAAAHGIQLVFTTGVKDPAAVIQFPNIIRLDNRAGRTENRRFIVAEEPDVEAGLVRGVRVAHADHPWDAPAAPAQEAG